MIYFTADLHLGNDGIIDVCNRPFRNSAIMDNRLIKNYNEIVNDDDDVYILGDFSLKTKLHRGIYEQWVSKLKGRKHLIMGNHDIKDPTFYSEVGFHSVHYPYFEVEEFVCVHDPSLSQVDRNRTFLCGHVHDLFKIQKNCINVGVDVWDFNPISISEARYQVKNNISDEFISPLLHEIRRYFNRAFVCEITLEGVSHHSMIIKFDKPISPATYEDTMSRKFGYERFSNLKWPADIDNEVYAMVCNTKPIAYASYYSLSDKEIRIEVFEG